VSNHITDSALDPIAPEPDPGAESVDLQANAEVEHDDAARKRSAAAWVISAAVHGTLIAIAAVVVFGSPKLLEVDAPPTRVNPIDPPTKVPDTPKKERTLEAKVELDAPSEAEVTAPTTTLDVPQEVTQAEAESDAETPKGREEAVADAETGGAGAFMAIGAGGGSAGMFGSRSGGGRKRAVATGGGSKGSEAAVEAALRWFVRHQSPNGSWPLLSYQNNCADNPKCEQAERHRGPSDDIGVAALGVLCFLGAGYDHKTPNKHRKTVKAALDWLLAQQQADGEFLIEGKRAHNYAQAMGVMALAEAYGMSADPALRKPVENGVQIMLKRRSPVTPLGKYAWGWNDGQESPAVMATSATSWNLQALKAVIGSGLSAGDGWDSGKQWLQAIWEGSVRAEGKDPTKLNPYTDETGIAYRYDSEKGIVTDFRGSQSAAPPYNNRGGHDLGCIGLVVGVFQGRQVGDPMLETLANYEMKYHFPTSYPMNNYYAYYNTLAFFQMGGERWLKWNSTVRDVLVHAQIAQPGSCYDGSWDPGQHYSAKETGRPLSTALNCLSLEVYYRYAQVKGHALDGKKTR
jgi:hypothetical protein